MSLMLNALKRIEAKQASTRTTAPTAIEPTPADAIESQSELAADTSSDTASEEIALRGPASFDAALSDLSELIAEARLLDRPPSDGAWSTGFSQDFDEIPQEDAAGDTGIGQQLDPLPPESETISDEPAEEYPAIDDTADDLWQEPFEPAGDVPAIFDDPPQDAAHEPEARAEQPEAVVAAPAVFEDAIESAGEVAQAAEVADPASMLAEPPVIEPVGSDPYAATAWQIVRQMPQGRSQVVLFTSPADGHGKTMTLAHLLPHLARSFSGNVLVVDANTRNPDMARWLDVAATWRLSDVLSGATDWMNAVRPTSLAHVSLLPGGADQSRRPNVQAVARLFRELSSHYDLVLVDATSLVHEGAVRLVGICDATYLVVRLGEGSRRIVRDAVRVVSNAGGRLLGCIAVDAGN